MNYKSLNSAIRSVTNPQPELVKEDYQTRERDRQMANTGQLGSSLDSKEKASKKVYGKDGRVEHKSLRAMIKKANWKDEKNRLAVKEDIQTPDRAAQSRNIVGDAVDRANNSETDRQDKIRNRKLTKVSNRHEMERKSKKTYGMGGKIVKKSTVKEEQEYIERLEFALESIAEELECDVEDLLEDLQTRGRYLQVDRKATHSERLADIKGRKERKSKKVYGMHGKELAPSAAAYFKKHPTASRLLHNPSTAGD